MILTDNEEFYELGKSMRAFGWTRDLKNKSDIENKFQNIDPKYLFANLGFNMRPTEIQGAFGIKQMDKLEEYIKIRIENAEFWNKALLKYSSYLQFPVFLPNTRSVCFGYSIVVKKESPFSSRQLATFLESNNIEVRPIMSGNMVEQPSSQLYNYRISGNLENSSYIMYNGLYLPNHQEIKKPQREFIAKVISQFVDERKWE